MKHKKIIYLLIASVLFLLHSCIKDDHDSIENLDASSKKTILLEPVYSNDTITNIGKVKIAESLNGSSESTIDKSKNVANRSSQTILYYYPYYEYSSIESEVLDLINDHRSDFGLNKLTVINHISKLCKDHNDYMISQGVPSHDNQVSRAQNLADIFGSSLSAEIVAYSYSTAQSVFNAWLNSTQGHKEAIEDTRWTHFGVSISADATGKYYFTVTFTAKGLN